MAAPEFVYLNEQAVRVTGWKKDDASGTIGFVVIASGEKDRDALLDLFSREPVMVRLGQGSAIPMEVRSLDTRSMGDGQRAPYRVEVSLWPEGSVPAPEGARGKDGLAADPLLDRLDSILELLTEIRDQLRQASRP